MPSAVEIPSTRPPSLHLAVIEFETPPACVFDKHGTYGDIVIKQLRRTLSSLPGQPPLVRMTKISVVGGDTLPDVAEIDAVLITGSKYTASDDHFWVPSLMRFIQQTYAAEKPISGICYGHQIIARALGGVTSRNPGGWELSVYQVDLKPKGIELFGEKNLKIYQMHRDAVIETPPQVEVIGTSPRCDVQVMYQPGRVLGFQGHPEFDMFITEALLIQRLNDGILDKRLYEEAMSRIQHNHDGALIATTMCKFFLGS